MAKLPLMLKLPLSGVFSLASGPVLKNAGSNKLLEHFSTGWTFFHRQHAVAILICVICLVFVSSAITYDPQGKATYRRLVHGCNNSQQC